MKSIYVLMILSVLFSVVPIGKAIASANDGTQEISFADTLKKAESGDREAQFILAGMYLEGNRVAIDAKKTFEWCEKSAMQGYEIALFRLGEMYYAGAGVQKDRQKAYAFSILAIAGLENVLLKATDAEKVTTKANVGMCHYLASGLKERLMKELSVADIDGAIELSGKIRGEIEKNRKK